MTLLERSSPSSVRGLDHVVGIDPGDTTGLCAIRLGGGRTLRERVVAGERFLGQWEVERGNAPLHVSEARSQRALAERVVALARRWQVAEMNLAIEDFVVRERTQARSLLSPVRQTSGLLSLLEQSEVSFVVFFNSASDGKSTISDKTLRQHGLYEAGWQHARDAGRQALLVLRKEAT